MKKATAKGLALAALIAGLAIGLAGSPALAERETCSFTVSYADLNLESEAGAKALFYRIRAASRDACEAWPTNHRGSLQVARAAKECYRTTLRKAVDQLGIDLASKLPSRERDRLAALLAMDTSRESRTAPGVKSDS